MECFRPAEWGAAVAERRAVVLRRIVAYNHRYSDRTTVRMRLAGGNRAVAGAGPSLWGVPCSRSGSQAKGPHLIASRRVASRACNPLRDDPQAWERIQFALQGLGRAISAPRSLLVAGASLITGRLLIGVRLLQRAPAAPAAPLRLAHCARRLVRPRAPCSTRRLSGRLLRASFTRCCPLISFLTGSWAGWATSTIWLWPERPSSSSRRWFGLLCSAGWE